MPHHHYLSIGCFQRELQYTTPTGMQKAIEFFARESIDRLNCVYDDLYKARLEDDESYEFGLEEEAQHIENTLKEIMYILESNGEN